MIVQGWTAWMADLTSAPERARRQAAEATIKTLHDIEATAKTLVPVDTGATKNSIGVDVYDDRIGGEVGPTTHYAPYLENGTARMAPRPFMDPAGRKHIPDWVRAIEDAGDF